ncbi:hypothetical protein GUJ93_ZPchr0002g24923 [Zizania palustris]|uniref:Uncharacterized protein n=1 Tax=Zizania palustris TaxID=103762 RepID=A0A8J5RGV6_ZIZPA|nr:hypothetical protein GUJ93_ZPchr0002g24923 [Zizania palustris]
MDINMEKHGYSHIVSNGKPIYGYAYLVVEVFANATLRLSQCGPTLDATSCHSTCSLLVVIETTATPLPTWPYTPVSVRRLRRQSAPQFNLPQSKLAAIGRTVEKQCSWARVLRRRVFGEGFGGPFERRTPRGLQSGPHRRTQRRPRIGP